MSETSNGVSTNLVNPTGPPSGNWKVDADRLGSWGFSCCGEETQTDATPRLDCLDHSLHSSTLQRDCGLHAEMVIEEWPLESQPACARMGWVGELMQQNHGVIPRTVRTGPPTMHSEHPTHVECTSLALHLTDVHHSMQTGTALARRGTAGERTEGPSEAPRLRQRPSILLLCRWDTAARPSGERCRTSCTLHNSRQR